MRTIESHKVNPANDLIQIAVTDAVGAGGANHRYELTGFDMAKNPSWGAPQDLPTESQGTTILFQNGPIPEAGVNGITQEVLIAICIDRLECFQAGPYACAENGDALVHLKIAQQVLQERTKKRMERGVEGTHTA